MKVTLKDAIKISLSKKDFLIYDTNNNTINRMMLTNDLYRYRKQFGINTKFVLLDMIKPQLKTLTINI